MKTWYDFMEKYFLSKRHLDEGDRLFENRGFQGIFISLFSAVSTQKPTDPNEYYVRSTNYYKGAKAMKEKSLTLISILFFLLCYYLISCSVPEQNQPPVINALGWATENIDGSFWTKWELPVNASAFFNVWVEADDPDGIDDITYVTVTNPIGTFWVLRDTSIGIDFYDIQGGFFGGWQRFYNPATPHVVYLGQYSVLVRDSAGNEVSDIIDFNNPGSSLIEDVFIYSEEYIGDKTDGTDMVHLPTITGVVKDTNTITIEFQVTDARVYNGAIWFYSASAEFITWSGFFKNTINGGSGLYNNGTTNSLVIQSAELDLGSFTWDDISGFHIALQDGFQYSPREDMYDHLSISLYYEI